MSILLSNEILDSVKKELCSATTSVQIITAYCKESSLTFLDGFVNNDVAEKRLIVRFRMDDIVKGSTDFSILEYGMNAGWDMYVRFDLHAKTYIVDNKRGLVGSANATNSGLSIGKSGNMEIATLVDIEDKDVGKINKLFDDAIKVDAQLISKMKKQLEKVNTAPKGQAQSWDPSITTLFNPKIETLFSYELPDSVEVKPDAYFSFLDEHYDGDMNKLRESFRWSNSYLWLLTVLKKNGGEMYFGQLSSELHDAMISDPKPFRKDVKILLANLLKLIQELHMEEVVVDTPHYSQRVRLIEM